MAERSIFKIFRIGEWQAFAESGSFAGSPDDLRDGFIHLSYAEQVSGTLARHYASEAEIVLAAFDERAFGPALRVEPSRGGALFPHLHGVLGWRALLRSERLGREPAGFALPDWCKDA